MNVAVISDIHGNLPALQAVLDAVDERGVAELWSLGDVVGYGADPADCCALVEQRATLALAGNHDLAVTGALALDDFSRGASLAAQWTREVLPEANREWLASLATFGEAHEVGLWHASPRDPVWEYVLSDLLAELCMDVQRHRIGLIGHSHVALSFGRPPGEPAKGEPRRAGDEVELTEGEWLLNPGSVGQPRDGDPRAAWLELDLDAGVGRWHRTEYDIGAAQAAIRAARLPSSLADRLQYGQ
jgi:diadenosine tetraphosphatase ApaH/serine/threonine PP2A family protein phosphatase